MLSILSTLVNAENELYFHKGPLFFNGFCSLAAGQLKQLNVCFM